MSGRMIMGILNLVVGALCLAGIWIALPARWVPIDLLGTVLALLFIASGVGLLRSAPWANRIALFTGALALVTGIALFSVLAITASQLAGLYGPVGDGGALLLSIVALLILPYLVVFPAVQVHQLLPKEDDELPEDDAKATS